MRTITVTFPEGMRLGSSHFTFRHLTLAALFHSATGDPLDYIAETIDRLGQLRLRIAGSAGPLTELAEDLGPAKGGRWNGLTVWDTVFWRHIFLLAGNRLSGASHGGPFLMRSSPSVLQSTLP